MTLKSSCPIWFPHWPNCKLTTDISIYACGLYLSTLPMKRYDKRLTRSHSIMWVAYTTPKSVAIATFTSWDKFPGCQFTVRRVETKLLNTQYQVALSHYFTKKLLQSKRKEFVPTVEGGCRFVSVGTGAWWDWELQWNTSLQPSDGAQNIPSVGSLVLLAYYVRCHENTAFKPCWNYCNFEVSTCKMRVRWDFSESSYLCTTWPLYHWLWCDRHNKNAISSE